MHVQLPCTMIYVCLVLVKVPRVPMGDDKWGDSDRIAFSLVGCDSITLAADGGLSFVCPTAIIINKY